MIVFVTLLLGLVSGVYPIEVTVSGLVAAVEFTLDGKPAGRISKPPWKTGVNLGSDLRPHQLVARALDAQGREISQASQWLNLPRPPAEAELVLEQGEDGAPKSVLLSWQSVNGASPAATELTLDGQSLSLDADHRAALPPRNLRDLHVLAAELRFPSGVRARKEVAYGGQYGSAVSSELTAVPVRLGGSGRLPALEEVGRWFIADGQAVSADAVEEGPGKVTAVCLAASGEIVARLLPGEREKPSPRYRNDMPLGPEDSFQFLSLGASAFHDSRIPADLFQLYPALSASDGGVFHFLIEPRLREDLAPVSALRIADAVAVAGLQAATENHRRAVILVLGKDILDSSHYSPAIVREYLRSIDVPLFVWSLQGKETPLAKAWGAVEDISTRARLNDAVRRLRTALDGQHIVWLDGRHLPQSVALSPAAAAARVEIAGREAQ
jgi:hypothetical protein